MAEFTPITTQEELDAVIKDRLNRQRASFEDKYKDFLSPEDVASTSEEYKSQIEKLTADLADATSKLSEHDAKIAERDKTIAEFQNRAIKNKVAHEFGMDWNAVDFLHGSNEDEIRESAEKLKRLTGTAVAPMRNTEPVVDDKKASYRSLVQNLTK